MENKRKVARPINIIDAIKQIDIFLGIPQEQNEADLIEYKRIDTFDRNQLKELAERKFAMHLKCNQYNTFNTFKENEIANAKQKQGWFNKNNEKENYYSLEHYIEYLGQLDFLTITESLNEAMNEVMNEAKNELIPYGYYYNIIGRNILLTKSITTKEQFKNIIKLHVLDNNEAFINTIKDKNEIDFKKELDIHLSYYGKNANGVNEWLLHTQKLVKKKITNRYLIYAFDEWINERKQKIKEAVIQLIKTELTKDFENWRRELNNPLATEIHFLNNEKTICEKGINKAHTMNDKLYHGKPSILLYNEINSITKLEVINERIELLATKQSVETPVKDITKQLWFKVALVFANGSIDKLKKDFNNNATQIAKHLGDKNFRPFISESISKTNKTDKNIFSNNKRLLLIKKHCEQNNIPICEDFLKHIKPE